MAKEKKLSKSVRKFIRKEKSRIHREFLDIKKRKQLIGELYKKFFKKDQKHEKEKI